MIVESAFTAERINSQLDLKKSLLSAAAMSAWWCSGGSMMCFGPARAGYFRVNSQVKYCTSTT